MALLGLRKPVSITKKPPILSEADLWWLAELCLWEPILSWRQIETYFHRERRTLRDQASKWGYRKKELSKRRLPILERNAKIVALAATGLTGFRIGEKVGVSASTVAGVCWRNGVHLTNRNTLQIKQRMRAAQIKRRLKQPPPQPAPPAVTWKQLNGSAPIAMADLEHGQCRWPLWSTDTDPKVFCGCKVAAVGSYCQLHRDWSLSREDQQRVIDKGWRR